MPELNDSAKRKRKGFNSMKQLFKLVFVLALICSVPAFATGGDKNHQDHTCQGGHNCNSGGGTTTGGSQTDTVTNTNNNQSNSTAVSGSTSGVYGSGNSSITDNSKTTNTNTAFGGQGGSSSIKDSGNSSAVGIGQGGQGGSVKDSGNSASFSSAQGGSVKDSGNSSNLNLNSAKGGDVKDSGNSYSSNKNENKQGQAQGQDQGQSQESVSGASASNAGNNTSITTNVEAPKIPVNSAYAPNAFPTANCAMAYSGAGQGMLAGAAGAFTRIDKTCQQIETARSFALYDARAAYCKVMISTKWAKKAKVTLEDCMQKDAVPAPTPAAAVTPEVKTPVAAIVNPYPSR